MPGPLAIDKISGILHSGAEGNPVGFRDTWPQFVLCDASVRGGFALY
jgi:hypothetical protein